MDRQANGGEPYRDGSPAPASSPARRAAALASTWLAVSVFACAVVCYGFGPLFQQRDQGSLMSDYRAQLYDASVAVAAPGETSGLALPPVPGAPVGILEIGALHLQEVVTEGASAGQTEQGPGHVPGTAGLGQPGNAVVVGRRALFGGVFSHLGAIKRGDEVLVTTTQGQSVYRVAQVARTTIYPGDEVPAASTSASAGAVPPSPVAVSSSTSAVGPVPKAVAVDALYGPTAANQLTLVTAASDMPWNASRAIVVVADMVGAPFAPTPQEGRNDAQTGTGGSSSALPSFVLVLMGYALAALGAVVAYRRYSARTAWLLTTAPLVALTVLLGQVGAQLLPAWL